MNENREQFRKLRDVAKSACEERIKEARAELKRQIEVIDGLEFEILGPAKRTDSFHTKNVFGKLIWDILPRDRPFGFREVQDLIESSSEENLPSVPTIRANLRRWLLDGKLKEVRNPKSRAAKLWAFSDVEADEPLAPLGEQVADILNDANSGMLPVEIGVQLVENGFEMEKPPAEMVSDILRVLRRRPDIFKVNRDGQWRLVDRWPKNGLI